MKFNKGLAQDMRNIAWSIPRMPPITRADEAEGIFLLLVSALTASKLPLTKSESCTPTLVSAKKMKRVSTCQVDNSMDNAQMNWRRGTYLFVV